MFLSEFNNIRENLKKSVLFDINGLYHYLMTQIRGGSSKILKAEGEEEEERVPQAWQVVKFCECFQWEGQTKVTPGSFHADIDLPHGSKKLMQTMIYMYNEPKKCHFTKHQFMSMWKFLRWVICTFHMHFPNIRITPWHKYEGKIV